MPKPEKSATPIKDIKTLIAAGNWKVVGKMVSDPLFIQELNQDTCRAIGDLIANAFQIDLMLKLDVEKCFNPLFARWIGPTGRSFDLSKQTDVSFLKKTPKNHPLRDTLTRGLCNRFRNGDFTHWETLKNDPSILADIFPATFNGAENSWSAGTALYCLLKMQASGTAKDIPEDFFSFAKLDAQRSRHWNPSRWRLRLTQEGRFHPHQHGAPAYIHKAIIDDNPKLMKLTMSHSSISDEYGDTGKGPADSILAHHALHCFKAMLQKDPMYFIRPRQFCEHPAHYSSSADAPIPEERRPLIDWFSSLTDMANAARPTFISGKNKNTNFLEEMLKATEAMGISLLAQHTKPLVEWKKTFSTLRKHMPTGELTHLEITHMLPEALEKLEKAVRPEPIICTSLQMARRYHGSQEKLKSGLKHSH